MASDVIDFFLVWDYGMHYALTSFTLILCLLVGEGYFVSIMDNLFTVSLCLNKKSKFWKLS